MSLEAPTLASLVTLPVEQNLEPWSVNMQEFVKKIRVLQWDDHRYYHQCRINQSLHLISAISFLVAYGLLFFDPAAAGLVGSRMTDSTDGRCWFRWIPLGSNTSLAENPVVEAGDRVCSGVNVSLVLF